MYKLMEELEIFRPEIEGKVAIVTGGSTGIGSETAKTLAALGAEVHFCGRNVEAGKAIEALFPAGNAHFAKVDLRAECGECFGGLRADARRPARHDGDLALDFGAEDFKR